MGLRDEDIRKQLRIEIPAYFENERDIMVVEELGCCQGAARIDVAVITTTLNGFEIKSDHDTLDRLDFQAQAYSLVFDEVTLIATKTHLQMVEDASIVPGWWGIWEAVQDHMGTRLVPIRQPKPNPRRNALQVASLLWRDEVIDILTDLQVTGIKSKTRFELWNILVEMVSLSELTRLVTRTLRARGNWRAAQQQTSNGGSSRRGARSQHSRSKLVRSRNPVYIGPPN